MRDIQKKLHGRVHYLYKSRLQAANLLTVFLYISCKCICSQTHLFSKWGINLWKRTLCGFAQSKSWDYWFATLRKKKIFLYWCFFMILSINHFYKSFNGFCGDYFESDTAFPFQKSKSLMGREWPQYFCFHNWLLKQFPSHSPNIFKWRSSILLWDKIKRAHLTTAVNLY